MTGNYQDFDERAATGLDPARIAYIKPTLAVDARKLGIIPDGIKIPDGVKLYVLHAIDGSVLGFTDAYDSAYGAAIQNDLMPMSVH
jgi:hypothetical protein